MKKFFIFALLLIVNCQLSIVNCQTMNVHVGNVCTLVPADSVGTMPYSGGSTVTIAGYTYNTADIDQITIDNTTVEAYTVKVVYSEGAAQIYCSADARPYLTFSTSGAYVSVTADASLADEITYVLSGTASDGQFLQSGSYKCTVELNGLTLSSASSAPILIDNGKRIRLRLTDGTTSTLADGATGTQKACLYTKGHFEFRGSGTLNITGNAAHAIFSKEYTNLGKSFGTINVLSAANDGLHVGQYFEMKGGSVNINSCQGDAIDCGITDDTTDEQNGQVLICGGTITLDLSTADDVKGIKCDSAMLISGGTISISGSSAGVKGIKSGTNLTINDDSGSAPDIDIVLTGGYITDADGEKVKTRGIKVDGNFVFDGGDISVSTTGKKAKTIVVDGTYTYVSGTIDCTVYTASSTDE